MLVIRMLVMAALACGSLHAQNPVGTWQGTLRVGPQSVGPQSLRLVIKIALVDDKLAATLYNIDQPSQPLRANSVSREGLIVKMAIAALGGTYEGKLSPDGSTMTGTWSQGAPIPLNLTRATPETAWTIPDPPPPPKTMPVEAKPSFEVAIIKPSKPEERFSLLVNRSGMLNTTGTSVSDLFKFAYDLHPRQISGGPSWLETDKFDVSGKPDVEGMPSVTQLKGMVQKLLAERFELAFHKEKKELSVYAITVLKTGIKIAREDSNPNGLPTFGVGPQGLNIRNATMAEVASLLQANILDQPVADQTGLGATRYNFQVKFTPDARQNSLGPAPVAPPPGADDAPPDIFTAFQQQLGLKLESVKAPVDVFVVDKLEKPSDN